jgi:RHS repeat-associated protein
MAYADPDAVTQIANGLSTTTFTYDNNGNVTQKTVDGTSTTYIYDYANRLTALGAGGATTTYAYDWAGNRVSQIGTTTTYLYPFKWYSVASSTGSGAKFATTTDYMFNGDTLLATVDQQTASGVATGTAKPRYVHPDHLGSTNVVTDESDAVVQTLDYYPYGSTRISTNSGTNEQRKYIGQFADQSGLDYLNARYYDSSRGQFTTQDPVFLGSTKGQDLANPQSLNSYSCANDNPVTEKDPNGTQTEAAPAVAALVAEVTALLARITAILAGSLLATGLVTSPQGQAAVSHVIDSSTQIQQSAHSIAIGSIMMFTPLPAAVNMAPIFIGATGATTPSTIGVPYLVTHTVQGPDSIGINFARSSKITEKPNGTIENMQEDFQALNPTSVKDYPGGVKVGKLPNGDTVVARPTSTDGRPTLEIQGQNGDVTKTRYGTKSN